MLTIELLAIGQKPPGWMRDGIDDYVRRMKQHCRFSIREFRVSDRSRSKGLENHRQAEAQQLLDAVKPDAWIVALDSRGKNWGTEELAAKMAVRSQTASQFQFLIGGPDGLADSCLEALR